MIQRRDQINILSIVFEMYQLINCVDGLEEGERGTRRGGGKRDKIKISLPLPPQKKRKRKLGTRTTQKTQITKLKGKLKCLNKYYRTDYNPRNQKDVYSTHCGGVFKPS